MQHPSLLRRLIFWQAAAVLVGWLVLSALMVYNMLSFGHGDLDQRMKTYAAMVAETASMRSGNEAELKNHIAVVERLLVERFMSDRDLSEGYVPIYQVWSSEGQLMHASLGAADFKLPIEGPQFSVLEFAGHSYRAVHVTSSNNSTTVAMAERVDDRISMLVLKILKVVGFSQLAILLWSLSVTGLAARQGFKPLSALANQLSARAAGDLSPLRASRLYSETAPVVREVNALLFRESERLKSERGFLADAAHELRTPLAAIHAQAHLLASTKSPSASALARQELQRGMDRVSHLLSQLLTLARLDSVSDSGARESLDLAELCRLHLACLARLARDRRIELSLHAPDALVICVQRMGFIGILENLVDNAIRYNLPGGHVLVTLSQNGTGFELQVRDDGPGIAIADRERVFERFVRLPHHVESGSGLGLAIVQRLAKEAGAVLEFTQGLSGRGVGLVVTSAFDS